MGLSSDISPLSTSRESAVAVTDLDVLPSR